VVVGKTGRLISRPGRKHVVKCKENDREVLVYCPPSADCVVEFGHQYIRVYSIADNPGVAFGDLINEDSHAFTESDLPDIRFSVVNSNQLWIFKNNSVPIVYQYFATLASAGWIAAADLFAVPSTFYNNLQIPTNGTVTATGAPTGYYVDYKITMVVYGQESEGVVIPGASTYRLPLAAGQSNKIQVRVRTGTSTHYVDEIRVYRRPQNAGAYGYIGSSTYIYASGNTLAEFDDVGQEADYSHQPPTPVEDFAKRSFYTATDPRYYKSRTGIEYQQRLLLPYGGELAASRTGYRNNFYRDYPLSTDSSLKFKAGSGSATILQMIDSDGLVVFTTKGVYLNIGALSPTNLSLDRKGNWVIDDAIPPLAVPGGVLFVDVTTNVIRHLMWSQEASSYAGEELSIYSNHLFTDRRIVSWGFHEGDLPVLFAVFDDGEYAAFTYERQHQMRAWTRADSQVAVEHVAGSSISDTTVFVVEKDGERYIEVTVPRYVAAADYVTNPEADKGESIAAMDSMVSWSSLMNDSLVGADVFDVYPTVEDEWDGLLTLTCGTSGIFTLAGRGAVGTVFRWFHPVDGSSIDLEVTQRDSNNQVIVRPSAEWPVEYEDSFRLYLTKSNFTGLTHLEGEDVAIIVDGYVVASPNNDIENYPVVTVSGGAIDLPGDLKGAIVHIGRPYTADVETLDIDTVEQRPVLIESQTVNKLYVKTYNARGLYVGNSFPADDKVAVMVDIETIPVD